MNEKIIKSPYVLSALAAGGLFWGVMGMSFNTPPLFDNTNDFALFAQEEVKLGQEVQISSGDVGSNKEVDIEKDVIVNGNLFADKITLDKNTQINGNTFFNKLKTKKDTQILGTQTTSVSLPIADIPEIPDFQAGTQDFKFKGQSNNLPQGNYGDIIVEKDSKLILTGGIYNISKLELKEGSKLIYSASTTLNIKRELKTKKDTSILPDLNLKPDDLVINYDGKKDKKGKKDEDEDNDDKDDKKKGVKSIKFGKNSFLNFKLLAPKVKVTIGDNTTLRGQIVARKIKVGKGTVVSSDIASSLQPKQEDIVSTEEGEKFVINQIILQLTPNGTLNDAITVANSINGRVVGTVSSINLYQVAVSTTTIEELDAKIQEILSQQNSKIKSVSKNNLINLIE